MNKSQLVEALADHFEGNKRSARHALESVLDTVTREVARGEKVAITGFGAFEKTIRPARMVRNPQTGARTRAKKKAVPKFRPGAEFRDVVSGAKKLPKAPKAASAGTAKKSANGSGTSRTTKKSTSSTPVAAAKRSTAKSTTASAAKKSTSKSARTSSAGTAKKTSARSTSSAAKKSSSSSRPAKKSTSRSASTTTRKSAAKKS